MKVRELIEVLQRMDPEIELHTHSCCYGADVVAEVSQRNYNAKTLEATGETDEKWYVW